MADGFNFSFEARLSCQSHHLNSMRAGVVWGRYPPHPGESPYTFNPSRTLASLDDRAYRPVRS
jgi:hypothetical protein